MSKANAVRTEPAPTYHRPALRVLANPRPTDDTLTHALTPAALSLGLGLWAAIITMVWLFV